MLLPSKEFLDSISLESSLNTNLANYSMSRFTDEDFNHLLNDLDYIKYNYTEILLQSGIDFRIKSLDSIKLKINKYKLNVRKAILCFNDIIGLRIIVDTLPITDDIPNYFNIVDLTKGKELDDGYRALHLYYKKSNRHYPIEIQIWQSSDENFINWSHKYCYKVHDKNIIKRLRYLYDTNVIKSEDDFKSELNTLCVCDWVNKTLGGY